ncbi:hypothetical protein ACG33_10147 [Steroidobacter denitrificans]|uniref:Glycosyl transferase family 1 domain-containing protein n=2 Tax=Steroidobacter denitrificans TaxID=465721 RepID=A0A127FAK4_STEDE|nr:hypothetical protein ACG33_10147 [Steroidobacter denitrificans]
MARGRRNLYLRHGSALAAAMKFPRENDSDHRQGNLLVLKRFNAGTGEKGVLYLQYTESISSFVALFDLDSLCNRYRIVVEPSSWGYQDDAFLLLIHPGLDVVILAQDELDFEYVRSLNGHLHPLRIGAGDWIDPYVFSAQAEHKEFDFVMVASWSPVKRHSIFFSALAEAGLADAPIALIGYPWEGRNQSHIEDLARSYGLTNVAFHECIPREEVARIIRRSRAGVMLTRREGANRGVYECLFSGVPVVISRENRGFNKSHITAETGILASDNELPSALCRIRDEAHTFKPREWALLNTGYRNAWRILNEKLRGLAIDNREPYTKNIALIKSAPFAVYDVYVEQVELTPEYEILKSFIRDSV